MKIFLNEAVAKRTIRLEIIPATTGGIFDRPITQAGGVVGVAPAVAAVRQRQAGPHNPLGMSVRLRPAAPIFPVLVLVAEPSKPVAGESTLFPVSVSNRTLSAGEF